ncbi:MAG: UDP-glucose/GDP-mannose dehydrogenase family protein [Bacteroidetes bacterium]|nr:UDP-glucose/GDP-mannose dehydrogenase family protein [Bacteroidota bacterium]MBL0259078.1 UDP-glucose/GDP-mannose dehydrogenase family protein [Bacteroidota bacterium]MBP6401419.1 UDP-glucose/GDP-mannose dehydrogenase family protein [Bacteroidia bacterium]
MKIAVVGTGYVGLVTGTCFAETGNHVICVDIDKQKVERLKQGEIPIYEPHLDVLFERNIKQGRLLFTTDLEKGIEDAQIIFLALPTPPGEDGSADLKYVLQVAGQLGHLIKDYKIVINKSTVPIGTAERVRQVIGENCKVEFDVVSNPEFLREGFAVDDFMKPDRVVIGTHSERAKKIMNELYAPFVRQGNPIYFMDERSAELTKYAANAFLATKISFMNEIANLCERAGANVDAVRIGIGSDDRIGKRFLFAGIGYGGSCFPKDVAALFKTSKDFNYDFRILDSVMKVNASQKLSILDKIKNHFNQDLKGKKIALWGLAFKPDTDDIREAPALEIIQALLKLGVEISAYDPEAMKNVKNILDTKIYFGKDEYDILKDADALVIATEWSVFRTPEFDRIASQMKNKIIFDGRNLYDLVQMQELGFTYYSVGRNKVN